MLKQNYYASVYVHTGTYLKLVKLKDDIFS